MSMAEDEAAKRTRRRRQDPLLILAMSAAAAAAAAVTTLPQHHYTTLQSATVCALGIRYSLRGGKGEEKDRPVVVVSERGADRLCCTAVADR